MRTRHFLVLPALLLGACASATTPVPATPTTTAPPTGSPPASASPAPSSSPSRTPGALIFRLARAGGFIAPSAELATIPDVSVYADGTIILPVPQQAVDPAPAMPTIVVEHVSAAGLQIIKDAANATGLADPSSSYDGGPAPDAGVTLITIDVGNLVRHVKIVSLGDDTRDAGLDAKVIAVRVKLRAFLAALADVRKLVGAELLDGPTPYVATGLRLIVNPGDPSAGNGVAPIAWPLSTPLSTFGVEIAAAGAPSTAAGLNGGGSARCGAVTGSDLATLLPLIAKATVITPWTSDGQTYSIAVRPLLPDETGCPGA